MSKKDGKSYFWIIIIILAAAIFGMIYFLSVTQAKEEQKSEQLENQLNEQISTTKGFKASVQQITTENETLKATLEEKESEVLALYKRNETLSAFSEVLTLYINQTNNERIKVLIPTIDRNALTTEQQLVLDIIEDEQLSE